MEASKRSCDGSSVVSACVVVSSVMVRDEAGHDPRLAPTIEYIKKCLAGNVPPAITTIRRYFGKRLHRTADLDLRTVSKGSGAICLFMQRSDPKQARAGVPIDCGRRHF